MSGKSSNKGYLAAAVGAGAIIGAAGFFLLYSLNNVEEKKKLESIQQEARRKSSHSSSRRQSKSSLSVRSEINSECSSRCGYESANETLSTEDEDDFYDANSTHEDMLEENKELFEEVDILMKGDDEDRLKAFNLLVEYESMLSENPDFLWRYAKAHQTQAALSKAVKNWEETKKYVFKGLNYAKKALEIDDRNPDVHKWFAILIGMQGDFLSIKEKIENGFLFQKHVLLAINYKPEDYSLHHLLGRFKYEVANVSWFEKKVAESLFGKIPDVTFSDAIEDLLTAEKLNPTPWKENRLLLARCHIGVGNYVNAIHWLESAKEITSRTKEDAACDEEINILIEKYKKYRK